MCKNFSYARWRTEHFGVWEVFLCRRIPRLKTVKCSRFFCPSCIQKLLHYRGWHWAHVIFNASRREHVTPLLRPLHWLRVPERITFKLVTLMLQCINGTAPGYLSADVRRVVDAQVVDVPGRKHLCSAGDRTFIVAAASVWNKLPQEIRSATPPVFRCRLKTRLFDCV